MAIAFRQLKTVSESSSSDMSLSLDDAPLGGSALIAVVGCLKLIGASAIAQVGAGWNLLIENGGDEADEQNGSEIRAQIWGAFSVEGAETDIDISFSGGASDRSVIVAEYIGDVFQFANPADRVVGDSGSTLAFATGAIDTGIGGASREDGELWIAVSATDQLDARQTNTSAPFVQRHRGLIGGGGGVGNVALLDTIAAPPSAQAIRMTQDHAASTSAVEWVAVMAAIRGILQVPNDGPGEPTSAEPVTEQTDYSGDGIEKLVSQFRARS